MRVLVTGATSGLGRATVAELRRRGQEVWATGRDRPRLHQVAAAFGLEPVLLDHRSIREVVAAAASLPQVDAVVCNAGVQVTKGPTWTDEGIEETVAVNHLSHVALLDALVASGRSPGALVFIGSATHDPDRWTGTPAPIESAISDVALARGGASPAGGLARYTTSKLMSVATAGALAREHPDMWVTAFDPGLMVDTGLGRHHPLFLRVLYRSVLKGTRLLPFASSSRVSAQRLADLLLGPRTVPSGSYVDHRLRPRQASTRAVDHAYQDALLADSRQIIADALRGACLAR